MKIEGVAGDVSAKGYENWIALQAVDFPGVAHAVSNTTGSPHMRVTSKPQFADIVLHKTQDQASVFLFEHAHNANSIPTIEIDYVSTDKQLATYSKYILSNVIVSQYREMHTGTELQERIKLSFTKIQKRVVQRDPKNQQNTQAVTGYDLEKAKAL